MKILMVCEGITRSSIVAQPWKHVFELAKRINHHGNDVKILTNFTAENSVENEINGIPVLRVKKGRFLFKSEQLLRYLNNEDLDVVNWHGSDLWSTVHIWRVRKKLKKNVIWTLHSGPLSIGDLRNLKFKELFYLYKFWNNILNAFCPSFVVKKWTALPQIKGVITLSQRLKAHLTKNGIKKEDEIRVIRSGVDVEKYNPLFKQEQTSQNNLPKFNKNDKIILYFGPLSLFRGVDTLLMALREVVKKIPSTKLLLLAREATDKKEAKKLEKLARRTEGVLLIKGVLEEEMLIKFLSLVDVVVLPFRFWPQVECPLTILESMAMGKPIVTTNVGALPEIVTNRENGILVRPGDAKILAEATIELLMDKDLSCRIGKNARLYVQRFHDWEIIAKQTLSMFQMAVR